VKKGDQMQKPKEKKLKKEFSAICKAKAHKISEVLGQTPEDFFGICDAFCFSTVNDIIDMIVND